MEVEDLLSKLSIDREEAKFFMPIAIFITACLLLFLSPLRYMWNMSNQLSRTLSALSLNGSSILDPILSLKFSGETPLYPLFDYLAISAFQNLEAGRLISFSFGLGTLLLIYKTAVLWFDKETAKYSMLLLAISPLFLLNSISIKRETMLLFFSSLSFLFLSKYKIEKKQTFLVFTGFSLILTALAKPVGVFIFVGVGLYLLYEEKLKLFKTPGFYAGIALPATAGLIFFVYPYLTTGGLNYGGSHVTWHLINYLDVSLPEILRNVTLEFAVLLPLPLLILAIGGIRESKGLGKMGIFWLLSGISFYIIFLSGAYHHTHYASMMLPPLAIIGARGVNPVKKNLSKVLGQNENKISKLVIPLGIMIALSSIGYCYADFIQPNMEYQEDMENVGERLHNKLENINSIGLTQNTQSIFYHIFPENTGFFVKKEIVRLRKKPLEELENLENKPEILIIQTEAFKYPSLHKVQGEESEWGEYPKIPEEDYRTILENFGYENYLKSKYFTLIRKK